eukprot:Gb_01173 [translate_table: standard]
MLSPPLQNTNGQMPSWREGERCVPSVGQAGQHGPHPLTRYSINPTLAGEGRAEEGATGRVSRRSGTWVGEPIICIKLQIVGRIDHSYTVLAVRCAWYTPYILWGEHSIQANGIVYDDKWDYEATLEHLGLASMAMISNGQEMDIASMDCSIGDTYLSLGRDDEVVFAYKKSLTVFKSIKDENHPFVVAVFIHLADLIYGKPIARHPPDDIASGLTEVLKILDDAPRQQNAVAGIEAQMGVNYYVLGKYGESYASFKNAVAKLRASEEKKSAFFGIVLNQMG